MYDDEKLEAIFFQVRTALKDLEDLRNAKKELEQWEAGKRAIRIEQIGFRETPTLDLVLMQGRDMTHRVELTPEMQEELRTFLDNLMARATRLQFTDIIAEHGLVQPQVVVCAKEDDDVLDIDYFEDHWGIGFTPYDGSGYFVREDGTAPERLGVCDENFEVARERGYNYVLWYNK